MKSKGRSQPIGLRQMSPDGVSSDEWFARYMLDAVLLVVLVLTAIGVALYLDGGQYLRDWSKEPGAGFLVCMLLCPMLGVVTLGESRSFLLLVFKEQTMINRSAFHLDCTAIIAEYGCTCGRCIDEMKAVFGGTQGVSRFYREGDGVVVEHDADVVTAEQLINVFRGLPSFYQNHFVPSVMAKPGGQD